MNRITKVLGSLFVSAALLVGSGGLAAAEEPEELRRSLKRSNLLRR